MKDTEIVALYFKRDEQAIQETMRKYEAYLLKIAVNILGNVEDGRECLNDVYLAAWNSIPPKQPEVLSTYLGKMMRQTAIDRYRKSHSEKRLGSEYALSLSEIEDCLPDRSTPEQEMDAALLRDAVNSFLHTLSGNARRVFIGRYYFFDSVKEVANYCGLSEANVKTLLSRTRKGLKEYLKKEGFVL